MNFFECVCCYGLGILAAEDLPDIAVKALLEGLDSPSLRILASIRSQYYDAERFLKLSLAELGLAFPCETEAALTLILYYMKLIVYEEKDPWVVLSVVMKTVDEYSSLLNYRSEAYSEYGSLSVLYSIYVFYDELCEDSVSLGLESEITSQNLKEKIIHYATEFIREFEIIKLQFKITPVAQIP